MDNEISSNNLEITPVVPERKFKKSAIIIIVLIICVSVVLFFIFRRAKDNAQVVDKKVQEQKIVQEEKQWKDNLDQNAAVDKDFDNLTDAEEKQYGTDPNKPDTDKDGILDGDEVKIHKTNPLKADTDGDGVKDGLEIMNGTNPLKK